MYSNKWHILTNVKTLKRELGGNFGWIHVFEEWIRTNFSKCFSWCIAHFLIYSQSKVKVWKLYIGIVESEIFRSNLKSNLGQIQVFASWGWTELSKHFFYMPFNLFLITCFGLGLGLSCKLKVLSSKKDLKGNLDRI